MMTPAETEAALTLVAATGHRQSYRHGPTGTIHAYCTCGWNQQVPIADAFPVWRRHLEEAWEVRVMDAEQLMAPPA